MPILSPANHLLPVRGGGKRVTGLFPGKHQPGSPSTVAGGRPALATALRGSEKVGEGRATPTYPCSTPQGTVFPTRSPHPCPHLPRQWPGEQRVPGC